MNYKALYRTYRPANFSEVEGQDHIVQTLTNLIKLQKISHAYLFSGPRGTGKTSVAKIFANVINCGHNVDVEVACPPCIMTINNSVDIIEIDAASNNGINEIRELREKIKFAPTKFKYKIYIIDEVHMLTKGAFNALLKTLEEPPKHVIFILATTDPDKLPLTILSRVQRYNFKRINRETIQKQVKYIFEREKIKSEPGVIEMISMLANGSLRDALSIADQINAFSKSDIKLNDINDIFGLTSKENQVLLLNYCSDNFVGLALKLFDQLINQGIDIQRLINSLIRLLKDYLLYAKTNDESIIEEFDIQILNQIKINPDLVYEVIDILIALLNEIKYSDIPQQLFQIAIIKICSLNNKYNNVSFNTVKENNIKDNNVHGSLKNNEKKDKTTETEKIIEINEITDNFVIKEEKSPNIFATQKLDKSLEFENEKILKDVTDILTLSNESNIDGDVVEGSILGQTDTESVIYDTNEFSAEELTKESSMSDSKTELFDTTASSSLSDENLDDSNFSFGVKKEEEKSMTEETHVNLTQPDIINLFLLGDKSNVPECKEKIAEGLLSTEEKYLKIISYLENCKVITSARNFVLVSSDDNNSIEFLSKNSSTPIFKDFIFDTFGRPIHFFAISKANFLDSAELFKELKTKDELPEPTPLPILEKREATQTIEKDVVEAEKKGMDIFGRIFKTRK
ncbi:MAG: DNA polymerase III subunit gamma/tau [Metamycoplasmataceae bacterium]